MADDKEKPAVDEKVKEATRQRREVKRTHEALKAALKLSSGARDITKRY